MVSVLWELQLLEEYLAATRAKLVRKIERHNGTAIALDDAKQQQEK
jgi:hypothetical protein